MLETIKSINMEKDSIRYINKIKKTGDYEKQLEQDKEKAKNGKMEILKIKSVNFF